MATIDRQQVQSSPVNDSIANDVEWRKSVKGQRIISTIGTYVLLIPLAVLFVLPFYWMVITALKTPDQIMGFPPKLVPTAPVFVEVEGYDDPLQMFDVEFDDGTILQLAQVSRRGKDVEMVDPDAPGEIIPALSNQRTELRRFSPKWENFSEGWNAYLPFNTYLWNSVKITVNNVIGNLVSCVLAAYAFARLDARGKNVFFTIILGTMVIPVEVLIIPQYILFTQLGWNNTHLPLMVPPWFGWPFFIFLLRQFFMTIPQELVDAALIDGASHFQIMVRIFVPLSKPALATVAIFAFIGNWNNFLAPLIYLQKDRLLTLPVGMVQFQGAYGNTSWHLMMAVATIVVIPVLVIFFFGQKLFVQGIAMTGLKG